LAQSTIWRAGVAFCALIAWPAHAAEAPVVVELFTSQSCSSCPPAEAYLGKLAGRADVLALEFHVDYWDDLVAGFSGRWKDAFSKHDFTERQRAYAARLPDGQVYTPQMVIDGSAFAVGSQERDVETQIRKARAQPMAPVSISADGAGFSVALGSAGTPSEPASVWLVRYLDQVTTKVRAGENRGMILTNHHIVTDTVRLGEWSGKPTQLLTGPLTLAPGESCAVLVQGVAVGPILAAATCPQAG
jgi:hypothetical protein